GPPAPARRRAPARVARAAARTPGASRAAAPRARCAHGTLAAGPGDGARTDSRSRRTMTTNRIRLLCTLAALFPLSGGAGAQSLQPQSLQPLGCLIEPHRVVELGSPVILLIVSLHLPPHHPIQQRPAIPLL